MSLEERRHLLTSKYTELLSPLWRRHRAHLLLCDAAPRWRLIRDPSRRGQAKGPLHLYHDSGECPLFELRLGVKKAHCLHRES